MKKNLIIYLAFLLFGAGFCFAIVGHSANQIQAGSFASGAFTFDNTVTAATFSGSGASLTNLDWNAITTNMPAGFSDDIDNSDSYWLQNGNEIYYNTDNVGIGITDPDALLHIYGGALGLQNGANSAIIDKNHPLVYSTLGTGGTFPFTEYGHLVLQARDSGSYGGIHFYTGAGPTHAMTIQEDGGVGIGISTPKGRLHIYNGDTGTTPNANYNDLVVEDNDYAGVSLLGGTQSVILFGDTQSNNRGNIRLLHASNYMSFGVNGTDKVYITDTGDVGIGKSTPVSMLHINEDGGAELNIANADNGIVKDDMFGKITFRSEDTSANGIGETSSIRGYASNNYDSGAAKNREGYLAFYTTNNDGSPVPGERMRINHIGRVGIGVTNPVAKLQVNGTMQVGESTNQKGITLYDTVDSSAHCVTIQNDALNVASGACS